MIVAFKKLLLGFVFLLLVVTSWSATALTLLDDTATSFDTTLWNQQSNATIIDSGYYFLRGADGADDDAYGFNGKLSNNISANSSGIVEILFQIKATATQTNRFGICLGNGTMGGSNDGKSCYADMGYKFRKNGGNAWKIYRLSGNNAGTLLATGSDSTNISTSWENYTVMINENTRNVSFWRGETLLVSAIETEGDFHQPIQHRIGVSNKLGAGPSYTSVWFNGIWTNKAFDYGFQISANNGVDGGAISDFTATLTNTTATLINTSNGTSIVYGDLSGLFNITINKTGFFNYTTLNYNVVNENPLNASMYYAKFHSYDIYTNESISNFSIFANGQTYTANGTQINYTGLEGLQNVTYSHPNYFNKTVEINITSSNYTFNETLTYYRARVNISAYTAPDNNSLIHNFTINVTYLNGTLISTQSTTTGSLWAELVWNISNNVTIDAVNSTNVTYEMKSVTLNGTEPQAYNFSLYSTNSFLLEFFDSQTLQLLNGTNVTFFMMGETSFNASTNNGTYYIDLLLPSEYTIVSTAPGYRQNQYIVTLTDRSHTPIDIYLVNETDSSLVLLTVQDKYGNDIQGADITVQKYVNNAWIDEQILRTDQNGQTEGAFIITTAYYNFYIDYAGVTVEGNPNNDTNKKTIYAEDVANGINFYIDIIQDQLALTYHDSLDISTNLSWVNTSNTTGYFRWFWNADVQWYGCLEVFKSGSGDTICSCNSNVAYASIGTKTCLINQSSGTQTYTAQGIIQIPTNNQFIRVNTVLESMIKLIGQDTRIQWGVTGYLIGFFILLVSYFIFLNMPTVSLFFGTGMFVILTLLGVIFKDIDYMVLITLMVITYLVATIKSEGGLNA